MTLIVSGTDFEGRQERTGTRGVGECQSQERGLDDALMRYDMEEMTGKYTLLDDTCNQDVRA